LVGAFSYDIGICVEFASLSTEFAFQNSIYNAIDSLHFCVIGHSDETIAKHLDNKDSIFPCHV